MDFSSKQFNINRVRSELEENGVAVVNNVISQKNCDRYIEQIDKWLKPFGEGFPDNCSSIIHKYNVGNLETAWKVRLELKPLFAALWQTEKLFSSTDGIAVGRPPEVCEDTKFAGPLPLDGLHYDQYPKRLGLHAYQGAVYLEEALEDDWCFIVMEKSNHFHQDFFKKWKVGESEYRELTKQEVRWLEDKSCTLKRVPVPKGSIVLWDSRTVHNGAPPTVDRMNPGRWRYIAFVCQTPAIWASPEDVIKKKEAYKSMKTGAHWPSLGVKYFEYSKSPYDVIEHCTAAESTEARLLTGDLEYDFSDGQPNGPGWIPEMV